MGLRHGLLGLLNYTDATGYELAKIFQNYLGFFWPAKSSQIYFELKAMEKLGWISSDIIYQETRPNRKLYKLTEEGRTELMNWVIEFPVEPEIHIKEFLIRTFFSSDCPEELNVRYFKKYCDRVEAIIEHLETFVIPQIDVYIAKYNLATQARYWRMTINYGLYQYRAALQWGRDCIAEFENQAQS